MLDQRDKPSHGVDLPAHERPGVPMERTPQALTPAAPQCLERQRPRRGLVKRVGLREMTPVFGTAQPLSGVSGLLRRMAYSVRETKARHWMILLAADRVDVLEHRIAKLVKVAAIVPAAVAGLFLAIRLLRD
jgi:hypothetical protein